jgi:hypothetical protein
MARFRRLPARRYCEEILFAQGGDDDLDIFLDLCADIIELRRLGEAVPYQPIVANVEEGSRARSCNHSWLQFKKRLRSPTPIPTIFNRAR